MREPLKHAAVVGLLALTGLTACQRRLIIDPHSPARLAALSCSRPLAAECPSAASDLLQDLATF